MLIYVQLEEAIFQKEEDFFFQVARTIEEAKVLIEAGFNCVCEFDNAKLFKKRKQRKSGFSVC